MRTISPAQLGRLLLNVAPTRTVFIWGAPGIGKSALVEQFARDVGLPCVSLLGSQLAPEDLIGVPRIEGEVSIFCPPRAIARREPYVLFVDELNACSFEVQKAFYGLLLDRRLGEYVLPAGSVVVGAGNRAQDQAIVKPMSSALLNRLLHVELRPTASDWLRWAAGAGVHPWVIGYLEARPDHLHVNPPAGEEPFSTPRSWHLLSDALLSYGDSIGHDEIELLAAGCLSPGHVGLFVGFVRQLLGRVRLESILDGSQPLPRAPADREVLYFLTQSIRTRLVRDLPPERDQVAAHHRQLAVQAKRVLTELCEFNPEMASVMVAEEAGEAARNLPAWFLIEVVRDLPRLAARHAGHAARN